MLRRRGKRVRPLGPEAVRDFRVRNFYSSCPRIAHPFALAGHGEDELVRVIEPVLDVLLICVDAFNDGEEGVVCALGVQSADNVHRGALSFEFCVGEVFVVVYSEMGGGGCGDMGVFSFE